VDFPLPFFPSFLSLRLVLAGAFLTISIVPVLDSCVR
jgi:hypothetical protein